MTTAPVNGPSGGSLRTNGATLYYEVRGTGPTLLISQSGEGGGRTQLRPGRRAVADYTVVTYVRRGLSRSTVDHPATEVSLPQHADDVRRLLAEVSDEPVLMLGCSLGASVGLHMAAEHPGQIDTLIAHEPVEPSRCCRRTDGRSTSRSWRTSRACTGATAWLPPSG